jgi:hypothetical protein
MKDFFFAAPFGGHTSLWDPSTIEGLTTLSFKGEIRHHAQVLSHRFGVSASRLISPRYDDSSLETPAELNAEISDAEA